MDLLAGIGVIFFLAVVAFLVNKRARDGICKNGAPKGGNLFILAGLIIVYNYLLAASENRLGLYQLVIAVYFMVPAVIATTLKPRGKWRNGILDLFLICWMWMPNDFGLKIILLSWGGGATGYCLTALIGTTYTMILLTGWRKVDFNLDWKFSKGDLGSIARAYGYLAVAIIPIALAVGFIHPGFIKNPIKAMMALMIWFAPALVEELIFRGVIQWVMIRWFRPVAGVIIAAIVFGFSHIDNRAGDYRSPNWWYVFFASVAGIFYGAVAHRRNLQSSTTLHFLVDFTWVLLFRSGK